MKLIIEKDTEGRLYIYRESEKHFKAVEKGRTGQKVAVDIFDKECNVEHAMEDGTYIVVDINK